MNMVVVDSSTKSLKDCIDFVYCKLRISEPIVGSDRKLKRVFNGISVNSWFTPMGISVCPGKDHIPYSPITKNFRIKLEERAKSASAVLGRRHFEIEQQEVGKDEILCGNNVFKSNSSASNTRKQLKSASGRFCGNGNPANDSRSKIRIPRPHTCHGIRPTKVVYDSLTISATSIEKPKSKNMTETATRNSKDNDSRLLSDFKTEHEMRDAFFSRVKSAPPSVRKICERTDEQCNNKCSIPLYWKTKSIYHRKQQETSCTKSDTNGIDCAARGSLWKPLLYNKDTGTKHKSGCPYKCKGCFRACLVSQDYMDKIASGKIQPAGQNRNRRTKPKFYHRKIVEYAIANAQPIKEMIEKDQQKRSKISIEDRIVQYVMTDGKPVKIVTQEGSKALSDDELKIVKNHNGSEVENTCSDIDNTNTMALNTNIKDICPETESIKNREKNTNSQ